ncbi:MAG: tRNA pseudouridine(55) synthase TruB [Alphaproteobacteria bacterium]
MARRRKGKHIHGWILLDKPSGLGSTPAVSRVKRIFDAQKAGHAGTLDPLAEGLLVIALGEATKLIHRVMDGSKSYVFDVIFGVQTDTADREGKAIKTSHLRPKIDQIVDALPKFVGTFFQQPPRYSAILQDGRRAYDRARAGEQFELPSREVHVDSLELLHFDGVIARLKVTCAKGFYVRALAEDLAATLGCVAHVGLLRRVYSSGFSEELALGLEKLEEMRHREDALKSILPLETVLDDIPVRDLDGRRGWQVAHGQAITTADLDLPDGEAWVRVDGNPLALGTVCEGRFQPKTKFNLDVGEK